jgi:hypothetical protein
LCRIFFGFLESNGIGRSPARGGGFVCKGSKTVEITYKSVLDLYVKKKPESHHLHKRVVFVCEGSKTVEITYKSVLDLYVKKKTESPHLQNTPGFVGKVMVTPIKSPNLHIY